MGGGAGYLFHLLITCAESGPVTNFAFGCDLRGNPILCGWRIPISIRKGLTYTASLTVTNSHEINA